MRQAVNCEGGKLPDPGDDAAMRVASAIEKAFAEAGGVFASFEGLNWGTRVVTYGISLVAET